LLAGLSADAIVQGWEAGVRAFAAIRERYLLYT
jgi:hypothetical protein